MLRSPLRRFGLLTVDAACSNFGTTSELVTSPFSQIFSAVWISYGLLLLTIWDRDCNLAIQLVNMGSDNIARWHLIIRNRPSDSSVQSKFSTVRRNPNVLEKLKIERHSKPERKTQTQSRRGRIFQKNGNRKHSNWPRWKSGKFFQNPGKNNFEQFGTP